MTQLPLQLSLSPAVSRSRRKRGHVPKTSVLAYQDVNRNGRISDAVQWLTTYAIDRCDTPTSMELARWFGRQVLDIRRAMSDAKAAGIVENGPTRKCRIGRRLSLTWRVRGR